MYQAKVLKLDDLIEEEMSIEINGIKFTGFASICPYKIEENEVYSVIVGLVILDDPELLIQATPSYGLEKIDRRAYGYLLKGKVIGSGIDVGNGLIIHDDIFNENSYLNDSFVSLKVDRISIEFV